MHVNRVWETKLVDTEFCDPMNKTICNIALCLFSGGGRGRSYQNKKTSQKECGLFCYCKSLTEWLREMAFSASGLPSVKGESLFVRCFGIFKGMILNHYSNICTSFRLCWSYLIVLPFLRGFGSLEYLRKWFFLFSSSLPSSFMEHNYTPEKEPRVEFLVSALAIFGVTLLST